MNEMASKNCTNKRISVERIYQKKTQLEHILLRPDTYIGAVDQLSQPMWVWNNGKSCIMQKEISFVPGLYKIFDEILVNAADNKQRDPEMSYIKISIDAKNKRISVKNDGKGVPVEMHKDENMYVPSMIFGHLLTSSNYDDSQKKVTGGRNGYGAKLCNIYSTEFTVETVCNGKHFKQTWRNNMSKAEDPIVEATDEKDFTSITYCPDLEKFKMKKLDDDTVSLLTKRAYDIAGCVRGIDVYLNKKKLPIKNFKDYIELYLKNKTDDEEENVKVVYQKISDRWEVALAPSHHGFQQASFVNSIATTKGGTHLRYIVDQLIKKLMVAIRKKCTKEFVPLRPHNIRNHLWVFINCLVENPAFDSQTKENMTLRSRDFGSECALNDAFIKQVMQSGIVEYVIHDIQRQSENKMTRNSGAKTTKLKGIPKLDDANDAGGKNSMKCTLILTEGDSAKTLAVSGLSVVGRDRYGVFPLRGKLLNVREASGKQLSENIEINHILKIVGLKYGKKYETEEDMKRLRYGRLMIMTDQDQDGSHIKGLLINFIHHNWPELLRLPFLEEFITPIVKVSKGKTTIAFYSIPEFEEWKENTPHVSSWNVKYYKGLGTSTPKEAKEYFADMERHRILFDYSGVTDDQAIDLAFSKKKTSERKQWLTAQLEERKTRRDAGLPELYLYGPNTRQITYTDFVNKELILFSNADNERSIPSVVDGLKPGQRKVLFTCFKRNDKREVKVAQLSGSVAELSAYHHGEQSLVMTIVNLAQNFVGSNNLNLLLPIGQFGTRIHGGKDAASGRYIFTKLSPLARLVFPKHDDHILRFLVEDNQMIEPEWYCPIIPMVLVNGAEGIGTGYSTKIPNFDVRQLVQYVRDVIEDRQPETLHPCYKNFKGEIRQTDPQKYVARGIADVVDEKSIEITELPIGTWTQPYKENVLESMLHGSNKYKACISDYKEYNTDTTVEFLVEMKDENEMATMNEAIMKKFNLLSCINLTNMVLFDSYGRIKKYETVDDIIREYYAVRLECYVKRKDFLEGMLDAEAKRLTAQARFILEKIKGVIVIENKKKAEIVAKLVQRGYPSDPVKTWKESVKKPVLAVVETDAPESESEISSVSSASNISSGPDYGYLVSMAILSLSEEKKNELLKQRDDKISELAALREKGPKDLWLEDLDAFLEELEIVEMKEREDAEAAEKKAKDKSKKNEKKSGKKKAAAKSKKSKTIAESENDDWGFSNESDNILSLTERLGLKRFEETSDTSSVDSKKSKLSKSKTKSADITSFMEKASKLKEDNVSSSTKVKKLMSPSKRNATRGVRIVDDDSDTSTASNVVVKASKRRKNATRGVQDVDDDSDTSTASNVVLKASKRRKTATKTKVVGDDSELSDDDNVKVKPSKRKKKFAEKDVVEIDSDQSEPTSALVSSKPSKSRAKKSKRTINTKSTTPPKRAHVVALSSDDDDVDNSSPVKRPSRRQNTTKKYNFDEEDESEEDDVSNAEDDWMMDNDDSDFDL